MEEYVFQSQNLTKRYKYATALDNVTLSLKRGRIYGFVGNNGAGKTTLMRMIMGLAFPDSGEISLFGQKGQRNLERQRRRIGALIEHPVFSEGMTAWQSLKTEGYLNLSGKKLDTEGILKRLKISASDVGKAKLRLFSMGMQQRYGLASALLGEPEFLVLDEPLTGVDPSGVKELRDLFTELNQEKGVTILLSSHILGELYQIATDYIFIHGGRIIKECTHAELEADMTARSEDFGEYFLRLAEEAEARG